MCGLVFNENQEIIKSFHWCGKTSFYGVRPSCDALFSCVSWQRQCPKLSRDTLFNTHSDNHSWTSFHTMTQPVENQKNCNNNPARSQRTNRKRAPSSKTPKKLEAMAFTGYFTQTATKEIDIVLHLKEIDLIWKKFYEAQSLRFFIKWVA